jgi:hypothetical protein
VYLKIDKFDYRQQQTLVECSSHDGPSQERQGHAQMGQDFFCWWGRVTGKGKCSQGAYSVSKRHIRIYERANRVVAWNLGSGENFRFELRNEADFKIIIDQRLFAELNF